MQAPEYDGPSPGWHRDADVWIYVSTDGAVWMVTEPGNDRPVWRRIEPPLSDDAVRKTPPAEELELFERYRRDYGIPS